jgi:hypothetical protein
MDGTAGGFLFLIALIGLPVIAALATIVLVRRRGTE